MKELIVKGRFKLIFSDTSFMEEPTAFDSLKVDLEKLLAHRFYCLIAPSYCTRAEILELSQKEEKNKNEASS